MTLPYWFKPLALVSVMFILIITVILLGLRDSTKTSTKNNIPHDDSGVVTSAAKEDTSDGTFHGDSKSKLDVEDS